MACRVSVGILRLEKAPEVDNRETTRRAGRAIMAARTETRGWHELIRMRTDIELPQWPTGRPSPALCPAADVVDRFQLW